MDKKNEIIQQIFLTILSLVLVAAIVSLMIYEKVNQVIITVNATKADFSEMINMTKQLTTS